MSVIGKILALAGNGGSDSRVDGILKKIPAAASETNQLADKAFVNSSISTATATFKGTFSDLDELKKTAADANDYAFYTHKDSVGNAVYDRYKYSTSWEFEYTLNNSSFTSDQWNHINNAYIKASTGIPKTDLASAVQTSLGKADTALQSETITATSHKANETALVFTDAAGTTTTVYVHTSNA